MAGASCAIAIRVVAGRTICIAIRQIAPIKLGKAKVEGVIGKASACQGCKRNRIAYTAIKGRAI